MFVPGALGGQKRGSEPLDPELQMVVSCREGSENQTWVLCMTRWCSQQQSPHSSPYPVVLNVGHTLESPGGFFSFVHLLIYLICMGRHRYLCHSTHVEVRGQLVWLVLFYPVGPGY